MCVGSAVPPGCPETNWQLEKLWLQGKASKARDGDKEERAGEGERDRRGRKKKKKGTRHNNIHKGRAGSAKCGQQSLYLCDADSPLFIPTFRRGRVGDKPRRGRESLHSDMDVAPFRRTLFFIIIFSSSSHRFSKQHLRVENNSSLNSPLNSVSIQGPCEQGLKPLLAALFSPFSFQCDYFTFKSITLLNTEVK